MPDNVSYKIIGSKGVMIQRTQSRCDRNAFEISFEEKKYLQKTLDWNMRSLENTDKQSKTINQS